MHDKAKSPEGELGPWAKTSEGGQGLDQLGGSIIEPNLEQNRLNSPQTSLKIGSKAGLEIGSRTSPEPVSLCIPARVKSVSVDSLTPRPWKHQSSYPLEQILSDINTGVQTRSTLKNLCAFYAFLSNIESKMLMKLL